MPFIILSKRCFRSILFIMILIAMPLIAFGYNSIGGSISKKADVGIYYDCSYRLGNIHSDMINFVEYTDLEAMKYDISMGITDCGYVFDSEFDAAFDNIDFKNSIDYIVSKSSALQPVANEFIFQKILEDCSAEIAQNYFDRQNIDANADLYYDKFLNSDAVFNISFENVNSESAEETGFNISYVFIIFTITGCLLSSLSLIDDRKKGITKYTFLYSLTYGIWLMLSLFVSVIICGELSVLTAVCCVLSTLISVTTAYVLSYTKKEIVCGIIPVVILLGFSIAILVQI